MQINFKKEYPSMSSSSRKDYKWEGFPPKQRDHLKKKKKNIDKRKNKEKSIKKNLTL